MADPRLEIRVERWPIAGAFTLSRGAKTEAEVVVARVLAGGHAGHGESVPYARYGETTAGVVGAIEAGFAKLRGSVDPLHLLDAMPTGAARAALDCALIDLTAKSSGQSAAATLIGRPLVPLLTAYTLSLAAPDAMAARAAAVPQYPLLKLKLGGGVSDGERMAAVRRARPDARLIGDANEAWSEADLDALLAAAAAAGLEAIEQPLPAGKDDALARRARLVPVIADESAHCAADLARLAGRYDGVNIKIDKSGGLTAGIAMARTARVMNFKVMVGCMVATSLAMAPAVLLAQGADWVDLDGPLLLAEDREPRLRYDGATVHPPTPALWG